VTDYARPEENTLGVIVGKSNRVGVPAGSTAGRAMRQASARGASLGTGYLGVGASLLAALQAIYGIARFVSHAGDYPNILPAALAWAVYALTLIGVATTIATRGEQMPDWLFCTFLFGLAGVVAFDLIAVWSLHDVGRYATAAASAGFGLLAALTLRRSRELLAVASILGMTLLVAVLLTTKLTPGKIPTQILLIATAVMPVVFGIYVVRRFRRIVQLELDRVLVQSTVSAPRFAVGMLASEELARLDLAAEELLESVATGRTKLPLSPKTASTAASLATELRLHLIEGRRETWLYHAITESEQLGKSVTLADRGSLAGLLSPQQRDGLLAAVWLLVSDQSKTTPTAQLTIGPVTAIPEPGSKTITVPLIITTTAVPRSRVDPATWDAIGKVGRFLDSTHNSSLRVEIECIVTNPADQ
jgi:FtsH-binding integral membrane protein